MSRKVQAIANEMFEQVAGAENVDRVLPPDDLMLTLASRQHGQFRLYVGSEKRFPSADELEHIREAFGVPHEADWHPVRPVRINLRTGRKFQPYGYEVSWKQLA